MKLFFDLEGFVFVVGLDHHVIERAVQLKYPTATSDRPDGTSTYISGAEYVKKIFQAQFTVPRVDEVQLAGYIDVMATTAKLPADQIADLRNVVVPVVDNLAGTNRVNPREVKRLVNAYTMQLKMLERKLRGAGVKPNAQAVIALQILAFRADWETAYPR